MFVIAGLGNPGSRYQDNRHNVGFMAADAIHRRHGFAPWRRRFQADVSEGSIKGARILLVKPQTYMNESGRAVGEALRFFKLDTDALLVLHDELDLPPGKLRVKRGGGHGGHNGLRSIDAHVGKEYQRLRIGIGHPGDKALVHNHVLGDFAKADAAWLEPLLDAIADHADLIVEGREGVFMNRLHAAAPAQEKPAAKPAAKGQSHIRQARRPQPTKTAIPTGPLADMLKKMFGDGDANGGSDGAS